ncbi:glycoside hydrolase family 28 protein [Lophiostoma macrostomum CBS 122681]|uniref:Glycoside hydrolase family 28 protein n=1 Tax=Lophiostoma macrostomum CBS 122681 TaxID=1314788 RepID=A0A6A6TRD7_9PLEO|nr:glycoside hydrolase family 28 protein [Lophiostoma macrostomum CBS 122681]
MRSQFLLPITLLTTSLSASPHRPAKRALCTVQSLNSSSLDDSPAINSAFATCGKTGSVVLPANQTFTLHSPIDLSPCRACEFRINGLVQINPDWTYWSTQPAVFNIPNTTAAIITTDEPYTGVIDAQSFGLASSAAAQSPIPPLFKISDASYQIHIRQLTLKNIPGTAAAVTGNSSAVRFYSLDFETPSQFTFDIDGGAQHVYVWNNTMRASAGGACVRIRPDVANVQVEESTCIPSTGTTDAGTSGTPSAFDFLFDGVGWIKNVLVRKVKASGAMDVVRFEAGAGGSPLQISNATFTGITIEGPAKEAVVLDQGSSHVDATDVVLRGFTGAVEKESSVVCKNEGDVCGFSIEDWSVVYGR